MGKPSDNSDSSQGANSSHQTSLLLAAFVILIICKYLPKATLFIHAFLDRHWALLKMTLALTALSLLLVTGSYLWNRVARHLEDTWVTAKDEGSVYLGKDQETGKKIYLKESFRTMHTQLIGTTNAGKTGSVVLPWAVNDIENGRGLLIVDGKSDQGFIDKLYAHAVKAGRAKDFTVFSLADVNLSSSFNPFCSGTPEQITERVFSSFEFTDEYYRAIQFSALRTVVTLIMRQGKTPMPGVIRELLRNRKKLESWLDGIRDENLIQDVYRLTAGEAEEFEKRYSGLVTALGHFSQGETAKLYNTEKPEIVLKEILSQRKICYFQLPTLQFPFLGCATGKLLLQTLQSVISELQVNGKRLDSLFSVYLDDFNDYIYPGFGSLLNKSRSANVGVVFSHQSLGDLEKVGPEFKQIVMTNTNIKVVMRSNDPDSAEHFAKMIGTVSGEKTTERRTHSFLGKQNTGEQSVRDAKEYIYHPNIFKSGLGLGEGIVLIPHPTGRIVNRIKFKTVEDLPVLQLPTHTRSEVNLISESTLSALSPLTGPRKSSREKKLAEEPEELPKVV